MKKLSGRPSNISNVLLGKITHKPINWFNRKDYILVVENEKVSTKGYAATLFKQRIEHLHNEPIISEVSDLEQLNNGDVAMIGENGVINIVYEKNSPHNALMLTERCNCSCIMCPQPSIVKETSKTPLNLKLISLMNKNTSLLGLTGGEPTLLGNDLLKIILACKKRLPKTELSLLTNGILLANPDFVEKIVSINHPKLVFEIPLYSDTDTEHDRIIGAKGFYKTIKGLYNLAQHKQMVGLRMVMHGLTCQRLPQFAEFIYRNFPFVIHVAFMQMETIGLAQNNLENLWVDPYDYNNSLEKAVLFLNRRQINVSIYNAQLCVLPKSLWKFSRKSISPWKNIYLDECNKCDFKEQCGGFFASSADWHSAHIKAIKRS